MSAEIVVTAENFEALKEAGKLWGASSMEP